MYAVGEAPHLETEGLVVAGCCIDRGQSWSRVCTSLCMSTRISDCSRQICPKVEFVRIHRLSLAALPNDEIQHLLLTLNRTGGGLPTACYLLCVQRLELRALAQVPCVSDNP